MANLERILTSDGPIGPLTAFVRLGSVCAYWEGTIATKNFHFSLHVDFSYFIEHVSDSPFTFVAIFDELFPGFRFDEYQTFAKHLHRFEHLNVFHMLHNSRLISSKNIFDHFNISFTDPPYYILFIRADSDKPIKFLIYRGSWKADDILRWVAEVTGLRLPLPGCIATLDLLAHRFRAVTDSVERERLYQELVRASSNRRFSTSELAKYYTQVAKRLILPNGDIYLKQEHTRLRRLIDSEVSDEQKSYLKMRLNVIVQFVPLRASHPVQKSEL